MTALDRFGDLRASLAPVPSHFARPLAYGPGVLDAALRDELALTLRDDPDDDRVFRVRLSHPAVARPAARARDAARTLPLAETVRHAAVPRDLGSVADAIAFHRESIAKCAPRGRAAHEVALAVALAHLREAAPHREAIHLCVRVLRSAAPAFAAAARALLASLVAHTGQADLLAAAEGGDPP